MRKPATLILGWLLSISSVFGIELSTQVGKYQAEVAPLAAGETNPAVKAYLETSLRIVSRLVGLESDDGRNAATLYDVADQHGAAFDALPDGTFADSLTREQQSFNTNLQVYLARNYYRWIALRKGFAERKYFETDTAPNANLLEGIINSRLALTKSDPSPAALRITGGRRPLGLSPWEAIFRLEPAAVMRDGPQVAIIGSAGLSFTFFPEVDASRIEAVDSPASKYLKKAGVRFGVGAGRFDGSTRLLVGPGVQVGSLAIWGLYEPRGNTAMLGIGASDLSNLKKLFGWF